MLPKEGDTRVAVVRKCNPQVKLPSAATLHAFTAAEVKVLKRLTSDPTEYVYDTFIERPEAVHLMRRVLHHWERADSEDSGVYGLDRQVVEDMERERFLFLRLNYCRWQMQTILTAQPGRRLGADQARTLLNWERAAAEVRAEIVRENVPLVLAMAKRTRITGVDLTDLISEGNLALLRAVNKFDSARGYKFSTYACRAILKSFSRVASRMSRYRGHFPTEFDPSLEKSDFVEKSRVAAEGNCVNELKSILADNVARLSDVEQQVILARFAVDPSGDSASQKAQTLEQVGQMIGVTKERVRQIQNKALVKLRAALEQAVLA